MQESTRRICFGFLPGCAEQLERQAHYLGNWPLQRYAQRIKYQRNAFYIATALTVLSGVSGGLYKSPLQAGVTILATVASARLGVRVFETAARAVEVFRQYA